MVLVGRPLRHLPHCLCVGVVPMKKQVTGRGHDFTVKVTVEVSCETRAVDEEAERMADKVVELMASLYGMSISRNEISVWSPE